MSRSLAIPTHERIEGRIAPHPGANRSTNGRESLHPAHPLEAVPCEMKKRLAPPPKRIRFGWCRFPITDSCRRLRLGTLGWNTCCGNAAGPLSHWNGSCRSTFDRSFVQATDRRSARHRHPQPLSDVGRERQTSVVGGRQLRADASIAACIAATRRRAVSRVFATCSRGMSKKSP